MTEKDKVDFLLEMKGVANQSRARGRRCSYTDEQKRKALLFTGWVLSCGFQAEDAAELLSVHRATLNGWLELATAPEASDREIAPPPRARIEVRVDAPPGVVEVWIGDKMVRQRA